MTDPFRYVDASGDCWEWTGTTDTAGYGRLWVGTGHVSAHRAVWEQLVGPIADGLTIDHLCRVRHCVNPDHLESVTHGENVRRGYSPPSMNARKTHCVNGHPFDNENTYYEGTWRRCRACNRDKVARQLRRKRSGAIA